ncbi:MAG: MFS transporter, partial [Promethearchaeota archaeon]
MIFVYTRSYLPIYFSNIIKIDSTQLSFVLFLSYLALLLRPPISIYFDRKNSKRKLLVTLSGFAILVSFSLMIFSLYSTLLFGVFYAILLGFISISTVGVNKIMISQSPDINSKNRSALLIQIGSISGSLLPIFIFLISVDSSSNWNIFFMMGIIFTIPLIMFIFFLKEKPRDNYRTIEEKPTKSSMNKKPIILISLFLFLAYSDRLFSYSIKPWISTQTSTTFFSILWFILILIYTLGNIIGGIFLKKLNCKKILLITTLLIGIILFLVPFTNFSLFMVIYGAYFFISGLFLIKLIPYKMELAQNRVFYYQLMTTFSIFASIIFIPVGTYLYTYIEIEIIIMIS